MIDVKAAVKKAMETIKELIPSTKNSGLDLEEVEFDDSKNHWSITIGFNSGRIKKTSTGPSAFLGSTTEETIERQYKVLRIDANTGEFISMKIRKI
jgi:hypothetical protein